MRFAKMVFCVAVAAGSTISARSEPDRTGQLQDLDVLRREYLTRERAFTPTARAQAEATIGRLRDRAGHLTANQFRLGVAEVVALADNGHSNVTFADGASPPTEILPIRLAIAAGSLFVIRAKPEFADVVGVEVQSIEGVSTQDIFAALFKYQGGTAQFRKFRLLSLIETVGMLHAAGLAQRADRLTMSFAKDGRKLERTLPFILGRPMSPQDLVHELWSPVAEGWMHAIGASDLPLYLQQPEEPFRFATLKRLDAWYLQLRANHPTPGHDLAKFADAAQTAFSLSGVRNVIVDLRFDMGGNQMFTRGLMRELAVRAPGKIYVIVGPNTFSAGMGNAAVLKSLGRSKTVIVGDDVGDRLRFWSEHDFVCLPYSKLCAVANTGLWDIEKGCAGESGCYPLNTPETIAGSLEPEIRAPTTVAAYLAKHDPAMDAIEADILRP